jgi:hypothetical protein
MDEIITGLEEVGMSEKIIQLFEELKNSLPYNFTIELTQTTASNKIKKMVLSVEAHDINVE